MKSALTERDHVERHHAAKHAPPRQAVAQHGHVADAVLQADDHDIGRRVPRDDIVVCNLTGHGLKQPDSIQVSDSEFAPLAPTLNALREKIGRSPE